MSPDDTTTPSAAPGAPHERLAWRSETLWQQLEPHLPGLSVEILASAGSTNSLLLERARLGAGGRV